MLAGTLLFAGCSGNETTTGSVVNTEDLPATINLVGITEKTTTAEAIEFVEEALNKITKTRFKTKVELTLVTADEYIDLIESRIAEADQEATRLVAIGKYNSLAQKEANKAQRLLASQSKKTSKWTKQATAVIASTLSTGEVYSAEETTVYEDGKIETLYPAAVSPIDIIMIDGKEMYDYLNEKDYPDARDRIDDDVAQYNRENPIFKNVAKVKVRDKEFKKTTTMKIARNQND
jgi:hypothetical protein